MQITYLQRMELNDLSTEVFGKKAFWYNQLHKKGVKKTKEQLEQDPIGQRKYFGTYEDIKTEMLRIKESTANFIKNNL